VHKFLESGEPPRNRTENPQIKSPPKVIVDDFQPRPSAAFYPNHGRSLPFVVHRAARCGKKWQAALLYSRSHVLPNTSFCGNKFFPK
jgi:hypothetical protein